MTNLYPNKISPSKTKRKHELSFRLKVETEEERNEAPRWPLYFLENLAKYLTRNCNTLGHGDHMPLMTPLGHEKSNLSCLLFAEDPQLLPELRNPLGNYCFMTVFGVTSDELEAAVSWNKRDFLNLFSRSSINNSLFVTQLFRTSILKIAGMKQYLEEKRKLEGSSQSVLFVEQLEFSISNDIVILQLPKIVVRDLLKMLEGRTLFNRHFFLLNPSSNSLVLILPQSLVENNKEIPLKNFHPEKELKIILDKQSTLHFIQSIQACDTLGIYEVSIKPCIKIKVVI